MLTPQRNHRFNIANIRLKNKLVLSPQPNSNPNQTLNQKQPFLQKLFTDEVAGLVFLLLKI
jgi:hypothetical protein